MMGQSPNQRNRFTNRLEETERFLQLVNGPPAAPLPLQMFYGVGGAGKTRLLSRLQQECQNHQIPWAAVDLAEVREADEALPRLAAQLEQYEGIRFDSFKRVLAVLAAKEAGGVITPNASARLQLGGPGVDLAFDALGLFPAIGQLATVVKLTKGASVLAFRQAMKKKAFREAVLKLGGEGELLELIRWTEQELADELLRRFAADLSTTVPLRLKAGRAILFFDAHEELWRDASGGAFAQDAWIRQLGKYLRRYHVLMVVAGRDHLRWPEDWDEKDAQGRRLWLEQDLVGGLSDRDALEFVQRPDVETFPTEPFQMPAELHAAVFRVTNENPAP